MEEQMDKIAPKVSGLNKFKRHKESPFKDEILKMPQRNKTVMTSRKAMPLADVETGEIEVGFVGIKQAIDKEEFIKIFKAELKAIFDLSKRAGKLISYFMQAVRINDDKVYFNSNECKEFTGYSNTSIQFALTELLEKRFIAKSDSHSVFFINPTIFFNGDRMVIYREYFIKSKKEMKDPQQVDLLTGKTNAELMQINSSLNDNTNTNDEH